MPNYNRGFTLIEGISVMLILGVLAVFAAPRFSSSSTYPVVGARDVGMSIARQIQLRAMQQEFPLGVCNALHIAPSRLGGSETQECAGNQPSNRTDVLDLKNESITISSSITSVSFDLLGRPFSMDGTTRLCTGVGGCKISFIKGGASSSFCLNGEGYFDDLCSG